MRKGIALAVLGLAVAAAAGLAVSQAVAHQGQSGGQGSVLWAERYNGPGKLGDEATSVAVSPGGKTVVVTGLSTGAGGRKDYATIAYSAATGARLWLSRYGGPGGAQASASAVAVSPSGDRVFVTGRAADPSGGHGLSSSDYVTVAYDLKEGKQLWVRGHYAGPYELVQRSAVLAVSPDGRTAFVSGPTKAGYLTVAYNAATGAQLWARLDKPAGGFFSFYAASALSVSRDGRTVLAAWADQAEPRLKAPAAVTTVAFRAATGALLWTRSSRATMGRANGLGGVPAISVSPHSDTVFVSASCSLAGVSGYGYVTIAYDIVSGTQIWVRNYHRPAHTSSSVSGLAVSPSGSMVYVTGFTDGRTSGDFYTTLGYRAATGTPLFVRQYSGMGGGEPSSITVGRSGTVYIIGGVGGNVGYNAYATVAYSAGGVQLWTQLYPGGGQGGRALGLAASPTTGAVYVTGFVGTESQNYDYATVAYRG
jgi:WD40 repeat protein